MKNAIEGVHIGNDLREKPKTMKEDIRDQFKNRFNRYLETRITNGDDE